MSEPFWLAVIMVEAIHDEALVEFGGAEGIRDLGSLDSAITRPRQVHHYDARASIFDLAAALCEGIVQNHPFVDGNKRTGLLAARAFLYMNGYLFEPQEADEVRMILGLASREVNARTIAAWFRDWSTSRDGSDRVREVQLCGDKEARKMRHWFVTSHYPEDLLRLVEAPDPRVHGDQPHWRIVLQIRSGDRVWFRDRPGKRIVGWGTVIAGPVHGPHSKLSEKYPRSISWRVEPTHPCTVPIPEVLFKEAFRSMDDGSAGFPLLVSNDGFWRKSYGYPLCDGVVRELERLC